VRSCPGAHQHAAGQRLDSTGPENPLHTRTFLVFLQGVKPLKPSPRQFWNRMGSHRSHLGLRLFIRWVWTLCASPEQPLTSTLGSTNEAIHQRPSGSFHVSWILDATASKNPIAIRLVGEHGIALNEHLSAPKTPTECVLQVE